MTVRAKFTVSSIEMFSSPSDSGSVKLAATNTKEGDNLDWSKWTPSGSIQMHIKRSTLISIWSTFRKRSRLCGVPVEKTS